MEAVVGFLAKASVPLQEISIGTLLQSNFPEYPIIETSHRVAHHFSLLGQDMPKASVQDLGWGGIRCLTNDKLQVAFFEQEGCRLSRLKPYQDWDQIVAAAMKVWQFYTETAKPTEVQRLSLRYINVIAVPQPDMPAGWCIEDVLLNPPQPPKDLPIALISFLDQDTFLVPNYPYSVRVTKTIQPLQGPGQQQASVIIDLDVSTLQPVEPDADILINHLNAMRWLKNKAFFGSITQKMVEKFK